MFDWSELKDVTELIRVPDRNLEQVRRRARGLGKQRLLLMVGGPLILVGVGLSAVLAFSNTGPRPSDSGPIVSSPTDSTDKSARNDSQDKRRFPKPSLPHRRPRGYILSDFRVRYARDHETGTIDKRYAKLGFRQRWEMDIFPGPRRCEFEVYNSRKRVVGHYSAKGLTSLRQDHRMDVTVPIHGLPKSGAGICFGPRLDAPHSGDFLVSNERLGPSTLRAARVIFDWKWTGDGFPPTQECLVHFSDDGGRHLYTGKVTITSHSERSDNLWWRFRPRPKMPREAASVNVVCENLT
jgi:hypothetical protein